MPSMHPPVTMTAEGGGHVLACADCHWTRFELAKPAAEAARRDHATKCKGPKVANAEPVARAPRSVKWDDREGATWIDSL